MSNNDLVVDLGKFGPVTVFKDYVVKPISNALNKTEVAQNIGAMPRQAVAGAETGLGMATNFLAHGPGAIKGLQAAREAGDWDAFGPAMSEHAEKYTYEPRIAPETAAAQQQWMEDLYKKYKTDGWDEGVGKLVDKGIIGPEIATFLHTAPDAALMAFFMKGPKLVKAGIEGSANALAGGAFRRANPGIKPDAVRPATPRLTGPAPVEARTPTTTEFAEKVLPHDALAPGRAMTPTNELARAFPKQRGSIGSPQATEQRVIRQAEAEFKRRSGGFNSGVEVRNNPNTGKLEFVDEMMNDSIREFGENQGYNPDAYLHSTALFESKIDTMKANRVAGNNPGRWNRQRGSLGNAPARSRNALTEDEFASMEPPAPGVLSKMYPKQRGEVGTQEVSKPIMNSLRSVVRPQASGTNPVNSLVVPEAEAAVRIARKQKRNNLAPDKPIPGDRANPRTVLKSKGHPDFVVGENKPADWKKRQLKLLTPDEITKAREWYREIYDAFYPHFGAETPRYITGFLIANKNVSPAGALGNALRAAEQLETGVPGLKAGLNHDALMKLFAGERIEKGVGQKLYDFADSAAGRSTRSFYGDDPAAGPPAVIDVHSARDAGYLDKTLRDVLESKGYPVENLNLDFKVDPKKGTSAAPSETQYERAGDWMRSLTDNLNKTNWQGGNWEPLEVQAVGWTSISKFTGAKAETAAETISKNMRRVSLALAPGRGSPNARFSDRFNKLPVEDRISVTSKVLSGAVDYVSDLVGVQSADLVASMGGWQRTPLEPSLVEQLLSSKEASQVVANSLGYLAQQEEVWVNKLKPYTANPKAYGITIVGKGLDNNLAIEELWTQIMDLDKTGFIQGFQPIMHINGQPGILVLINQGGKKVRSALDNEIDAMFDVIAENRGDDIMTEYSEAEIYVAGKEGGYDGEAYLEGVKQAGRPDLVPALRNHRGKLEKKFEQELKAAEKAGTKKRSKVTNALAPGGR